MAIFGNIYINSVAHWLADAYGAGTYNSGSYGCDSATSDCGGLTNTGIAIGVFVGVAALIALIAVAVRVWRRPKKNKQD